MAASTSDAKTYNFLGGGYGQNVGLGMVFNLLKEKISGLGVEGIKSTVKDLESDVNTLQENVATSNDTVGEHDRILWDIIIPHITPNYIKYADLKKLVVGKKLNMLSTYILTDYKPILSNKYSETAQSTDSIFGLMLIANTNSTFFHECLAVKLTSNQNSIESVYDLKILYDFNNDESKYDWIADDIGNGVIYRMIDEYGNDCPYDFYNIKFNFGGEYYYTFSGNTSDDIYFAPERFTNCHIDPLYENHTMTLPRNCMSIVDHTIPYNIHDIHIKGTNNRINAADYVYECNNIEIQSDGVNIDTLDGSKAVNCVNISIGTGCTFSDATISGSNIKIGNNCQINSIRGNNIKIGDNCANIQIGTSDVSGSNITIGNNCQAGTIIGEFIRLEDGVILKYSTGQNLFPLYNVSFKSGNGETPITLQLESGFSISENIKIGDCVFYLGTFYNSDGVRDTKFPYTFKKSDWNGNQNYIKMVYPNDDLWITEIKK